MIHRIFGATIAVLLSSLLVAAAGGFTFADDNQKSATVEVNAAGTTYYLYTVFGFDKQLTKDKDDIDNLTVNSAIIAKGTSALWYGPVEKVDQVFPYGDWTLFVCYKNPTGSGKLTATVYDQSSSSKTILAQAAFDVEQTKIMKCVSVALAPQGVQKVPNGHRLVLELSYAGNKHSCITILYDHSCLALSSITAPVPELPSYILMGTGLIGLGGFIWLQRRRRTVLRARQESNP